MQIFFVFSFIIGLIYFFMIVYYANGWSRMKAFKAFVPVHAPLASIIIPVRNEQENIVQLLYDLLNQQYPDERYEIIVVNDHSTDKTNDIVFEHFKNKQQIKLIELGDEEKGKKKAVKKGVLHASFDLIITIDGDVSVGDKWLPTLLSFYGLQKPDLVIAPVLFKSSRYFPEMFQALEMFALAGVNGGSCEYKSPLMCNGANLAFKKSMYIQYFKNNQWASGDDMFLLIAFKKAKKKIAYLKSIDAVVWGSAKKSFREIMLQKQRWVSKYKGYDDAGILLIAFIVLVMNVIIFVSFIVGLFYSSVFILFCILMGLKMLADLILIRKVTSFFNQMHWLKYLVLGQLLYPFYATMIGIIGNARHYQWKGRKVR